MERKGVVTAHGNPVTLIGPDLKIGNKAPDFTVLDSQLKEINLKDFSGKIKIISVTPSLDTPVCDLQARRFNQEAAGLPDNAIVLNISVDLPFAIGRFCATGGIDKAKVFSDHRDVSFGTAYGVLIKELRLLARSIFILSQDDTIRYIEIVPELTNHPNYDRALEAVNKLLTQVRNKCSSS
jgi:thiol peroxidase